MDHIKDYLQKYKNHTVKEVLELLQQEEILAKEFTEQRRIEREKLISQVLTQKYFVINFNNISVIYLSFLEGPTKYNTLQINNFEAHTVEFVYYGAKSTQNAVKINESRKMDIDWFKPNSLGVRSCKAISQEEFNQSLSTVSHIYSQIEKATNFTNNELR